MRFITLALLFTSLGQTVTSPSPVHVVYDESSNSTEIRTNWLYVLNADDQFLQMRLIGRFEGRTMPKTGPRGLQIEITSHAVKSKYDGTFELVAIADGVEMKIGGMIEHTNLRRIGSLPATAAVVAKHKIKDLASEWIVASVSWEALTALAKADKINWRLGTDTFSFMDIQVTRLKQFVTAVTQESGVVAVDTAADNGEKNQTSEADHSSLKDTLNWLRKQISQYAADSTRYGQPQSLSLTKFNGCNIEWQLATSPADRDVPSGPRYYLPMTSYYAVSLKDLDVESVEVTRSGDSLSFSTLTHGTPIKQTLKDARTGQVNPFATPQKLTSASFALKENHVGREMREALIHAIKLCQSGATK